ncbi:MAG: ABC transporter permease [Candidatus Rokubacteria bacterium]|nr:ABC transporter permease [Candidatus Rokubacteria bacterium]
MIDVESVTIGPTSRWGRLSPSELWRYRELVLFLVWRNLKVRYKQAVLGAAWAVLQPLLHMIIFSIFFGRLAKVPSDGVPFPLFAYVGLLPWQLFASALGESANSLIADERLVTKVYFPRIVIPVAAVLSWLLDFAVSAVLLVGLMAWFQVAPGPGLLLAPVVVVATLAVALGVGLWLSALNVQYRDVRYTLPFLTQVLLFLSPVAYPSSLVPEAWRWLYGLNPMAGVVESFRSAVLGTPLSTPVVLSSAVATVILLVGGIGYFGRMERTFADMI